MESKRGQFYLIASLAIIVLISGIFFVSKVDTAHESPRVEELAEELEIEAGGILDSGAITESYNWDEFTGNFSAYAKDVKIAYVVGTVGSNEAYYYEGSGNRVDLSKTVNTTDALTLIYDGRDYIFQMHEGENFFYVVSQEIDGEKYIARN